MLIGLGRRTSGRTATQRRPGRPPPGPAFVLALGAAVARAIALPLEPVFVDGGAAVACTGSRNCRGWPIVGSPPVDGTGTRCASSSPSHYSQILYSAIVREQPASHGPWPPGTAGPALTLAAASCSRPFVAVDGLAL